MAKNYTSIFDSPVWSFDTLLDNIKIKDYILHLKENDKGRTITNNGGWQSNNLHLQIPELKDFFFTISNLLNDCFIELGGKSNYKVKINDCWANVNNKGDFNWPHTHEGFLSIVYYVQADDDTGDLKFNHPSKLQQTQWQSWKWGEFNNSTPIAHSWVFKPFTNRCYIFPSWLEHLVHVNDTNKTRISLSLNSSII